MSSIGNTAKYFHFTAANIITKGLLTGLIYGFLIYLSAIFIFPVKDAPILWAANSLPVVILLFNRSWNWPLILLFCALGLLAHHFPTTPHEVGQYLMLSSTNLLQIVLLATVIREVCGRTPTKKRLRSLIITNMWASAAVILATSLLSVVIFSVPTPEINFLNTTLRIFSSAYLGQVLFLPAILCYVFFLRSSLQKLTKREAIELTLMWVILFLFITITWLSLNSQTPIHYIFPYMTFPFLVWSALRLGIRVTITCSIISSLFSKYLASLGHLPFGSIGLSAPEQIAVLNVGLIALNVTALILAIMVADQKQIRVELTHKDEWFQIAIDNMSGGLYMLDQNRNMKILSTGLREKFELPTKICHLGANVRKVFEYRAKRGDYGPGNPDFLVREKMASLEGLTPVHGQNTPPNGRTYEFFQNHTNNGEIIVIYHDITERLKAAEDSKIALLEAQQANKAKTDFLANMSHELRTPLNAIIGFSELMTKENFAEKSAAKVREYSEDIHMSGRHLLQIINDILDLSKIEAGMADVELEPIHLDEVIKESVTFIQLRAADAGISIVNDMEDMDDMILADRRLFKQIMVNLLSNAVKFTPAGGNIHICHTINDKGETTISITDTGIGIAEEDIEHMMEPFRQADSSLSKEFEGTGLGLPLVKSLMELHDGSIVIKSKVGSGTAVFITFPPHHAVG